MKRVFAVLLLLPAAAWAQIPPPAMRSPQSINAPHSCYGFYPEAARLAHVEGKTALACNRKSPHANWPPA